MRKKYDFTGFIREHQGLIFGNNKKDYSKKYCKNIAALDMKMNELLAENREFSEDPRLLLGLFALSVSRFGPFVKTDAAKYQEEFYDFLKK